jgi:flagellar basal-body rod protein FlgB
VFTSLFNSTTVPLLEQVVNFTEARHGVLAGNIANLDTPGYRTRDLSPELFQQQLREAVEASHASLRPVIGYGNYGPLAGESTNAAHDSTEAFQHVKQSLKGILRHDESNVSMEQQVNEMVKNQTEHNLAINVMAAQFRLLRAAITERVV